MQTCGRGAQFRDVGDDAAAGTPKGLEQSRHDQRGGIKKKQQVLETHGAFLFIVVP